MNTKHIVHFDLTTAKTGQSTVNNPAPTLCGKVLKKPVNQSFYHDDEHACPECVKKMPSVPSPKYPMMDTIKG